MIFSFPYLIGHQACLEKGHLFGSLKENEECDYDHTMMDNPSAQGSEKGDCSVDEDNSNMYKDVS